MREYSSVISLTKNARGVSSLDPSIGCSSGMSKQGGCYNDCYAAKSAKLYGYDFSKTVLRHFKDEAHRRDILRQINAVNLDFVRMGTSGDPSEFWEHTIDTIKKIQHCNKQIVIITKHWTNLTDAQLEYLGTVNVCVNTSVSALDNPDVMLNGVEQYKRLKSYCKSVLRVVTADFNLDNDSGRKFSEIQSGLLENESTLDTVLRVNPRNPLIKDGIINTRKASFLGKNALVSKYNPKTYLGKCSTCSDDCGLRTALENRQHPAKPGIKKQLTFL